MNIIVRMPNWLGDFIMGMPLLEDLKDHFPKARIVALCKKEHLSLLNCETMALDDKTLENLKKNRFDMGILLTNSFSSALLFWRGNVKNRIGFSKDCRRLFLNVALKFKREGHLRLLYKELLKPLGIENTKTIPRIEVREEDLALAKQLFCSYGSPVIGISPFVEYGPAKCWPKENFQKLASLLIKSGCRVIFFGTERERERIQEILPDGAVNLAGKTSIRNLAACLKLCSLFITNDSGPMHMAAALGVKLIALFGSTSHLETGPQTGEVIYKGVCPPCFKRTCSSMNCMKAISVEEVFEDVKKVISKN